MPPSTDPPHPILRPILRPWVGYDPTGSVMGKQPQGQNPLPWTKPHHIPPNINPLNTNPSPPKAEVTGSNPVGSAIYINGLVGLGLGILVVWGCYRGCYRGAARFGAVR